MNKDKSFPTSNFGLAQFLFVQGFKLVNLDWTDQKRCQFVFVNSAELLRSVEIFNFAKENDPAVMVDARELLSAGRSLKDRLYQTRN